MNSSTPSRLYGILMAVTGCSCWGFSGIFAKILFDEKHINAMWLVTVRLISAGIILLILSSLDDRTSVMKVWEKKNDTVLLLAFAFLGMMPSQACFFLAISFSNPAVATVLQYISPVLIMLVCCIRDRTAPKPAEMVILFMVMTGVFLISTHGNLHRLSITPPALFWGLVSAFAVMIYTLLPTKLIKKFGILPVVGWGMLLGGIILLPFTRPWNAVGIFDSYTLFMIMLVVIVGTVIAFTGYLQGVKIIGPVHGSLAAGTEPVVSALFTALILHVSFTTADIAGMILVVLSVTAISLF